MSRYQHPVAVIGAGPIGLAAAAHLVQRDERPIVFEAGPSVGANILAWGHVRIFSPWSYTVDSVAGSMLEAAGWTSPPADVLPTGREIVEQYLLPLADLPQIAPTIRLSARVVSVARRGFDKMKTSGRDEAPFAMRVRSAGGAEEEILARAVIDASGTYQAPNPLGANGLPALGEAALANRISYGIPDVLGEMRARYEGRRVMVVGSGHSAFNVLLDLVNLATEEPGTEITWVVRRSDTHHLFGGERRDLLPARGDLGARARQLVESGMLRLVTGFKVARLERSAQGIVVSSETDSLPPVDEIVAVTGFRPDLSLTRELRLELDPAVESPAKLATLIDPNVHSCGTVPPHGYTELSHPETGYYTVGMKSYGRAPTFLMLTGYEQVRSVVAAIVGDLAAAESVELTLPETGICSTGPTLAEPTTTFELPVLVGANSAACCGTAG